MSRFLSREEWPLIAAGVVAGLLTAALVLYFFITGVGGGGDFDRELASDTTSAAVERRTGAPVIGARQQAIETRLRQLRVAARPLSGPLRITARNLVWNERGNVRFARADLVRGQLRVEDLERGDVVLDNVVLQRPVVALRERSGGSWNYEEVFAELLNGEDANGDPRPSRRRTVQLTDVRIGDAEVNVTRPNQQLAFQRVQASLPLIVLSRQGVPEPYLRAARVTGQMVMPAEETRVDVAIADGLFSFPEGRVRFDVESATINDTRFASLEGVWNPADPGYGVTATGRALDVDFEDVRFALPASFPRAGTATFSFDVRPLAPDRTHVVLTELNMRSGESRMLGDVTLITGGERVELIAADLRVDPLELSLVEGFTGALPYGGALTGTITGSGGDIGFDLVAILTAETVPGPFTTGVTGSARLAGGEFVLEQLDLDLQRVPLAAVRAVAPGLPLTGVVTGRVSLTGPPGRSPLDVNVRLELGNGVAVVEGVLDLTGARARYDLAGRIIGVDLQQILAPDVPPVHLTASFALEGAGFDPATMDAGVRLSGRFSGWETTPNDTVRLLARIGGGTLAIDTLVATLVTADLAARGNWRFIAPETGAVGYALAVSSLRPFGPYLPLLPDTVEAAGWLQTTGTVAGTLARPRFIGTAAARGIAAGGWRASELDATYDVMLGGDLPRAVVDARAVAVETPTAGRYRDGTFRLEITPPSLALTLNAVRTDGGLVEVVASGELIENGPRRVVVERARFDLASDRWQLVRPTVVTWVAGGPVNMADLEFVAERSEGRVVVDGRVLPLTNLDARVQIAALPVGDLQRLLAQPVRLDGLLWAEGTIRGGERAAQVDLTFRVDSAAIQEVPVRQLQGRLVHADNETQINATMVVDTAGRLDLVARLPTTLRLAANPSFELIDGVPLSGSLTTNNFALAPLAAWIPDVQDVTGTVDAQVTLSGTADQPQISGAARLVGGAVRVPVLNQEYTEITGDFGFDGRRLVIRDMRMRSEGFLVVGGQVVLERLTEPVFDLTFTLDGFQPLGVEDFSDAEWTGRMALRGPPGALVMTGEVEVADGYFAIPEFMSGPATDPVLVDITTPASVRGRADADVAESDWARNLRIDNLIVNVAEDAWFATDEARVQLTGQLTVNKIGDTTPIVGTLTGTRGQYTLIAGPIVRRFDIVSAQVRFIGTPQPNPLIDITARRIVLDQSGRQFDVNVRITGTMDNPTLALAGGQPGEVAESELLSFLLFGQPSFALGSGEGLAPGEQLLTQTYLGAVWEVAALELERELGGLGLDIFQVRLGQGPLGGIGSPTFVLGRQISQDVFLTVEMGVAALLDNTNTATTNTWAMRLDWAFDRRSRLRLALEPVIRGRTLRSSGLALPLSPPKQQLLVEVRRRWVY